MRVEDLHHKELLEPDPEGGVIRFAGQRALLENSCMGHAACNLLGRTREEWGDERAEELGFFESGRLKESPVPSSPSIAAPSPRRCWRASCSDAHAERSPARPRTGPAFSRPPIMGRSCWTR